MAERRGLWVSRAGRLRACLLQVLAIGVCGVLASSGTASAADSCLPAVRTMCEPEREPIALNGPRPAAARALSASQSVPRAPQGDAQDSSAPTARPLSLRSQRHRLGELSHLDERLLKREIANVSRLLRRTPVEHSEHARALRRLAESYVELAELAADRYASNKRLARAVAGLNAARAGLLRRRAGQAASQERRARLRAVRLYRQLLAQHPHHCRFASQPDPRRQSCGDEVLRYLANELDKLHEPALAQQVYAQLRQQWPSSQHAAAAALAQAEWHFKAAAQDHGRWSLAQHAYQAVLKYPPGTSLMQGYAAYKLGHVHRSLGRYDRALDQLTRATRLLSAAAPSSHDRQAPALLEASRRDLVTMYALAGDPTQALAFFLPLSGDPPGHSERAQAMVLQLGEAMQHRGQLAAAGQLYQQLAAQTTDDAARCTYQAVVTRATEATHPTEPEATVEALGALEQAYQQARKRADRHATRHCLTTLLEVAGETALAWRIEALGDAQSAGTGNPATIAAALRVFGWLAPLQHQRSELHYAHGELLLAQQFYSACAEPFEAAFVAEPQGARAADALLGASRCWMRQQPGAAKLDANAMAMSTPKQVGNEAQTRLAMYEQLACRVSPADHDGDAAREHAAIANLRTRIYLDQGRLDAATAQQRDVALHSTDPLSSMTAAGAYLRGMELLQQQDQLPQCAATLKQDSKTLQIRHCGDSTRHNGSVSERRARLRLCRTLASIQTD